MKIATSLADAEVSHPSVLSIGNFDGLHLGHREILKSVVQRARELGLQSAAMTFSPHPICFLAPDRAPRLISTLEQRIRLIEDTGIDILFIAKFDHAFSRLSPEEFIRHYLIDGLKARSVCVGGNFNFGYGGGGSNQKTRAIQGKIVIVASLPGRARATILRSSRALAHLA